MNRFFSRLHTLDRRIVYLALGVVLVISLLLGKPESGVIQPQVQQLYDVVNALPTDKLAIVDTTFAPNTLPENGNQARALIRHLVLTHHPFILMALDPQGATLGQQIAEDVTQQYGAVYGKDWINFGFQLQTLAFDKGFPKDMAGWVKQDATEQKPLTAENFPILQGVTSFDHSISLLVEVTASSSVDEWISIVQPATHPRLKIGYACTNVMATSAFPYLSSGQMTGMMAGLKGAADYEQLVDQLEENMVATGTAQHYKPQQIENIISAPARQLMFTQSWAHLTIILFIVLGNIGVYFTRRRKPTTTKEAA